MIKNITRNIIYFACLLAGFGIFTTLNSQEVAAVGWIGYGSSGSYSVAGSGGGDGAGESAFDLGVSWIYYKYDGGGNRDIVFTPTGRDYGYTPQTIPAACAEVGGFWHLGRNMWGRNGEGWSASWWPYFKDHTETKQYNWYGDNWYSTLGGRWGHWSSVPVSLASRYGWPEQINKGELDHYLRTGGDENIMYHAEKYGDWWSVFNNFKEAYRALNNADWNEGNFPGDTYAFCYSPDMGSVTTSYESYTTLTVTDNNGGYKRVTSGWDGGGNNTQGNTDYFYTDDGQDVTVKVKYNLSRTDQPGTVRSDVGWQLYNSVTGYWSGWQPDANFEHGALNGTAFEKHLYGSNTWAYGFWDIPEPNDPSDSNVFNITIKSKDISSDVNNPTRICRGIYHDSIVLMRPDGSARASQSSGSYSSSYACVNIFKRGEPEKLPDPTPSNVEMSFIGEPVNGLRGGENHFFYLNDLTGSPSNGDLKAAGSCGEGSFDNNGTCIYLSNATQRERNRRGEPGLENTVRNSYGILKSSGLSGYTTTNPRNIPDEEKYVGYKICAFYASSGSRATGEFRWESYIEWRPAKEGETGNASGMVAETKWEYVPVFDWYYQANPVSCAPIAKKPNIRATDGSVYSSGDIKASYSKKTTGPTTGNVFGSWGEYLVISGQSENSGFIVRFGSGASLRKSSDSTTFTANTNSPLSIANYNNNHNGVSGIGREASEKFIERVKSRFECGGSYKHIEVICNGDIPRNIISASHDKIKIIIADNIKISPVVDRIDAWLIATNTINTCDNYTIGSSGSDALNADKCRTPLTVNGLVYAKNFVLSRTAGANGGSIDNNFQSAEIFNLPAGAYSLAYRQAESEGREVSEVYLQELAPRT